MVTFRILIQCRNSRVCGPEHASRAAVLKTIRSDGRFHCQRAAQSGEIMFKNVAAIKTSGATSFWPGFKGITRLWFIEIFDKKKKRKRVENSFRARHLKIRLRLITRRSRPPDANVAAPERAILTFSRPVSLGVFFYFFFLFYDFSVYNGYFYVTRNVLQIGLFTGRLYITVFPNWCFAEPDGPVRNSERNKLELRFWTTMNESWPPFRWDVSSSCHEIIVA